MYLTIRDLPALIATSSTKTTSSSIITTKSFPFNETTSTINSSSQSISNLTTSSGSFSSSYRLSISTVHATVVIPTKKECSP